MAEDIGSLISNYGDMSIEELGGSLLQRQADQQAAQAKEDKKGRRFQQAMGLLLAGQAVYKTSVKKRLKELDDTQAFNMKDNTTQAKQVQVMGRVLNGMPPQEFFDKNKGKDPTELSRLIVENDIYGKGFKQKLAPVINTILKQGFSEAEFDRFQKTTAEYDTAFDGALQTLVSGFVEPHKDKKGNATGKRNYEMYESELRELLDASNLDDAKLFQQAIAITPAALDVAERRYYSRLKTEYSERGMIQGFKDIFTKVGNREESRGRINLFRNVSKTDVYGSNLNDVLTTLNLEGPLITSIDKSLAKYRGSASEGMVKAITDPDLIARSMLGIQTFGRNLGNKRLYNSDNTLKMSMNGSRQWQNYIEDFGDENGAQMQAFAKDVAGLTNTFKSDTDFALAAYTSSLRDKGEEVTDNDIAEFYNKITAPDNESYRMNIAIAVAANEGFTSGGGFLNTGAEYYQSSFNEVTKKYKYDRYKGSLPTMLGEGISTPSQNPSGNFQEDESYSRMSPEDKKISFDKNLAFIEKAKISDFSKIKLIENLFDNVRQPEFNTQEEYLEAYAPETRQFKFRSIAIAGPNGPSYINIPINEEYAGKPLVASLFGSKKKINKSLYENKEVGKKVTADAIDAVVNIGSESKKYKENLIGFLNDNANMESSYGTHRNTFTNTSGARGIMQIVPSKSLAELKRRIDTDNPTIVKYNEKLKSNFNIDLTTVTAKDLEIPLVNVAVSRGYYMIFPEPIPYDKRGQANYWLTKYNTGDGNATVDIYLKKNGYHSLIKNK
tara:strand:- start:4189 stop:6528 length:2340 start_codon:yes stop_codon:yes gene_type:complete